VPGATVLRNTTSCPFDHLEDVLYARVQVFVDRRTGDENNHVRFGNGRGIRRRDQAFSDDLPQGFFAALFYEADFSAIH
jgi:hypothetical protein